MKRKNKGFTMMELLIVVAIIGILIAIAVPNFTGQVKKAGQRADNESLKSLCSTAASDYRLEKYTGVKTYYCDSAAQADYDGKTTFEGLTPSGWTKGSAIGVKVSAGNVIAVGAIG